MTKGGPWAIWVGSVASQGQEGPGGRCGVGAAAVMGRGSEPRDADGSQRLAEAGSGLAPGPPGGRQPPGTLALAPGTPLGTPDRQGSKLTVVSEANSFMVIHYVSHKRGTQGPRNEGSRGAGGG